MEYVLYYNMLLTGYNQKGIYMKGKIISRIIELWKGAMHVDLPPTKARFAFTLAEVLITLGIIGVVAAMTIPTLMTTFAKKRTETQLKTFYSKINQTVKMSIADNGDPEGWITINKTYTYDENVEFLKTYFFPYMKTLGYENCANGDDNRVCIYLMDGGIMTFRVDGNGGDIAYYINLEKEKVLDFYKNRTIIPNMPRHYFAFQFAKKGLTEGSILSENFVEPYIYFWNRETEQLINSSFQGCNKNCYKTRNCAYCTKLIQINSWKIPNNYPW